MYVTRAVSFSFNTRGSVRNTTPLISKFHYTVKLTPKFHPSFLQLQSFLNGERKFPRLRKITPFIELLPPFSLLPSSPTLAVPDRAELGRSHSVALFAGKMLAAFTAKRKKRTFSNHSRRNRKKRSLLIPTPVNSPTLGRSRSFVTDMRNGTNQGQQNGSEPDSTGRKSIGT